jgi:thiamine monophosphate synthase
MPLPHHYLITPNVADETQFLASLEKSLQAGTRLMLFKAKGLGDEGYRALAARVIALAHRYDCQVLLTGDPAWVSELGADGLHLDSKALAACTQRPLPGYYLLAVSGHSLDTLNKGSLVGASFAVLSPINYTSAHPDIAPLGWQGLSVIAAQLPIPVYALGGVSADDESAALEAGGQGIAGHKGYWRE